MRWINDLVDPATGNYLPHLFPVDQTLALGQPAEGELRYEAIDRTDCETEIPAPYTGPVPLVTHVHGAHVQPHSDGYPEAWWLPGAPAPKGFRQAMRARLAYDQADNTNTVPGSAYFGYENTQAGDDDLVP